MSLTLIETDWIDTLAGVKPGQTGVIDLINEVENDQKLKAIMLKNAREALESQVGLIKLGEDFEIGMMSEFLKKKFTLSTITDDPNDGFDTGHDFDRMDKSDKESKSGGLPPEQFAKVMQAQAAISKQSELLQNAVSLSSGKKLFTDREIADAIWEPLKRRKLIPENAIPDRYSEASRTFAGASAEYETRLVAFTQALPDNQKFLDGLGIAKDVFDTGGAIVGSVIGNLNAIDPSIIKNPTEVASILKGVQVGISSTITTTQTLANAKNKGTLGSPDTILAVVKEVTKATQSFIGAGYSGGTDAEIALGKAISTGVGMAINVVSLGVKVKKGDYLSIADDLAEMVTSSFAVYSSNLKVEGGKDLGPNGTKDKVIISYSELGMVVGNAIKAAGKVLTALKDPTPEAFIAALIELVRAGTYAGSNYFAAHVSNPRIEGEGKTRDTDTIKQQNPGLTEEEFNKKLADHQKTTESDTAYAKNVIESQWTANREGVNTKFAGADKKIATLMQSSPEEIAKAIKEDPQLKGLAKLVEAQQKQVQEEGLAAFKEEIEADNKSFRDMLNRSETAEDEDDIEQIEALIMQLKRDQMMVDLAFQLASMPAQAIAAFLPQAGIAVSAIELIKNFSKAAQHFKAYQEWRDNVADARSAMSVQVEAMTNRMDLSRGQTAEAVVKALEEAAKLVGGAVSVAGPFAPAGHAIAATMGGVSALRGLIVKYYREKKLADAWKLYLSARSKPEDRKLVRESIRKNPTLAKYVIAYGAEIDNNPVARSAMVKCGLTHDVLDSKDANVQKVVSFLEALYPEDPVLMRPLDEPMAWYPGPVEFAALSFAAFAGAAQSKAKPKLMSGAAQGLIVEFTAWDRDNKAYVAACKDWEKKNDLASASDAPESVTKAATAALHHLQQALAAVERSSGSLYADLKTQKPLAEDGKPHAEMIGYMALLLPICVRLRKKYRREATAVAQLDGAMV